MFLRNGKLDHLGVTIKELTTGVAMEMQTSIGIVKMPSESS
jgi:hypothetical protein